MSMNVFRTLLLRALALVSAAACAFTMGGMLVSFELFPFGMIYRSDLALDAIALMKERQRVVVRQTITPNKIVKEVVIDEEPNRKAYTAVSVVGTSSVFLVNNKGERVYGWTSNGCMCEYWSDFYIYPNGDLLFSAVRTYMTPYGVALFKLDKDSNIKWKYDKPVHHHFSVSKNGYIYGVYHEMVSSADYPAFDVIDPYLLEDFLFVLNKNGQEVKSFSLIKALSKSPYSFMLMRVHGWDTLHASSAEVLDESMSRHFPMFKPGQVLVTLRNLDAIGVVDVDTEEFVWLHHGKMTAPQHAVFSKRGEIWVLDNSEQSDTSKLVTVHPATGKEKLIMHGTPDDMRQGAEYGSIEFLPNGRLVIADSRRARVQEVDPNNYSVFWEFVMRSDDRSVPKLRGIYSAHRYMADYFRGGFADELFQKDK